MPVISTIEDKNLRQKLQSLQPGDHLCCIYQTEEEHRNLLTPFMTQGLERGEKVVYIVDIHTANHVYGYLREAGLEVERFLRSGQLSVLSTTESYLRETAFDPDRMISLLARETKRALAEGFAALRVTGEMTWALQGSPGSDRLVEYEAKLNEFFPHHPCLAICQYDKRRFGPSLLLDVLTAHPLVVVGTTLHHNFYYMPCKDLLGPDPDAARLENWLGNLDARGRQENALRESRETARALLNAPTDAVALLSLHGEILDANETLPQRFGKHVADSVGLSFWDLLPDRMAKQARQCCDEVVRTGESARFEYEQGGAWFDSVFFPVPDAHGCVAKVGVFAHDVTERREMERKLVESESRYRTLVEQIPAVTYVAAMDEASTTLFISPQVTEMLGFNPEQWKKGHDVWLRQLHPDDRDRVLSEVNAVHANGAALSSEYRMITRDGRVVWIDDHAVIVKDDEGKPCFLQGVMFDITDRKRAEEALRQAHCELERRVQARTEELTATNAELRLEIDRRRRAQIKTAEAESRFRTVADFTYDWEYWRGPDGTLRYVSPSCQRITGYKAEQFVDRPSLLEEIVLPEDRGIWSEHVRESTDEQESREIQFRIRTRDDNIKWIEHACRPIRGTADEFLGFRASNRDITARKEAEAELKVKESAIASSINAIGMTDPHGRMGYVNDSLVKMWGYDSADEILGRMLPEFWKGDGVYETVRALRETGARTGEDVGKRKDGSLFDVHFAATMIKNEAGEPECMFGSFVDVTEQKKAAEDLKRALAEITELKERLERENVYLRQEIHGGYAQKEIVGQSEPLRLTLSKIEHVADTDATVLLVGETGTGKELLAHAIHDRSARRDRPLVEVNCAALPRPLIESELFGHVKGAFTGAFADKVGRFELADGGSIFLDEIGELDPDLQVKLLRVLQEGKFERIGSTETITVDVRVIAATNRDLHRAMSEERFRPDLYYRLAVFPIEVPPLRLRREDVPLLAWHFITRRQARLGKTFRSIPASVMNALVEYDWPGNVRELQNVIERSMILSPGPALTLTESLASPSPSRLIAGYSGNLEEVDRAHIVGVLEECKWKIKGADNAAERLGPKPSTLRYRMKKLGIERPPRRPR